MPAAQQTTDWVVPQRSDLYLVLEAAKVDEADANVSAEARPGARLDLGDEASLRSSQLLAIQVERFREAVRMAGRYPLSVTPAAVPTDALLHVLRLAAFDLMSGTARLVTTILTKDLPTWQKYHDEAESYLEHVRTGGSVPPPKDPAGRDYLTAVSAANPAPSLVRWSDLDGTEEEHAAGRKANGNTILPVDLTTY